MISYDICLYLTSFSMIISASIHVPTYGIFHLFLWLSNIPLEKEMATHSSVLAWRIPGTGESDGLPSMGSHRVGHDWSDLVIFHYVCVCVCVSIFMYMMYNLYPLLCQWTLNFFHLLTIINKWCYEQWGACKSDEVLNVNCIMDA